MLTHVNQLFKETIHKKLSFLFYFIFMRDIIERLLATNHIIILCVTLIYIYIQFIDSNVI